jgi:hypothetical protein
VSGFPPVAQNPSFFFVRHDRFSDGKSHGKANILPFMKTSIPAVIGSVLACALSGCISSTSTSYSDVERTKVAFASERAGRLFYETLSRLPHERREESKNQVSLILVHVERKTVTGRNRFFNEAVERCDTDKDATITEDEAQIFAASVKVLAKDS